MYMFYITLKLHDLAIVLPQAQKEKRVAVRKLEQSDQKLHKIFGPDQLTALTRRSTRGLKWEIETVKKALKLRFVCGTAGYNEILSSGIPLPSARTLQERLQNISFQSGVLLSVFDYLKEKVCQNDML